jgi:hypothetical protein
MSKTKWKIFFDMCLNIGASGAPIAVLQLIIYPYLASRISSEEYGLMITLYSLWIVISNSLGNVLNNIRLLRNAEYEKENIKGDFPFLLKNFMIINFIIIFIGTIFYIKELDIIYIVFSIVISMFILLKAYFEVGFRIKLDYVSILINGILQCFGFILGLIFFYFIRIWQFVFLCGFLFNTIFTLLKTEMLKEAFVKTRLYKSVSKDAGIYTLATFSGSLMTYADKMVLYPLMGGHVVSIYYTATILGKIISMISGPVTGVILSYISKWSNSQKKIFSKILIVGVILAVIGYGITMGISYPVINILFPQWKDEVMIYLPITTIAIAIQTLNSFLNPFILKFYDMKWQIIIGMVSVAVYFVMALVLWNFYGMIGFCIGTVLGQLSKTLIMVFLHFAWSTKESK